MKFTKQKFSIQFFEEYWTQHCKNIGDMAQQKQLPEHFKQVIFGNKFLHQQNLISERFYILFDWKYLISSKNQK